MNKYLKFIVPVVLITLAFGYAFIQMISGENPADPANPAVLDDFAALKTIAVLAFVFLLLGVFAWLAKSWFAPLNGLKGRERHLKILDSLPVSPKSKITLVKVANETLLLGITEKTITVLSDIEISESAESKQEVSPRSQRFLSVLRDRAKLQAIPRAGTGSPATNPEK